MKFDIEKAVGKLILHVERASKAYLEKNITKYKDRIESVVKQWRRYVRQQLSVKAVKGQVNTSLYPKMRSGELRESLINSRIVIKPFKVTGVKHRTKAEIVVPITYEKLKNDYGEILNSGKSFRDKTFSNWKGRLEDELIRRLKGRI